MTHNDCDNTYNGVRVGKCKNQYSLQLYRNIFILGLRNWVVLDAGRKQNMLGLTLTAELNGVTDLTFADLPSEPYDFTFTIRCNSCREIHGNEITINQYEQHSITGSRGEANFVFKCKNCKRDSSAVINISKKKVYTIDDSTKQIVMLEIDPRGIDFVKFNPDGRFIAKGSDSNIEFNEVDLEDNEWFDYDEKAANEVSITEVKWNIIKL